MKKITIMGIVSGVVLAVGIFSNIGLFGNNALAEKPTIEQKITTMFWFITNPEFGLKEIKREVIKIEENTDFIKNDLQQKRYTLVCYQGEDISRVEDVNDVIVG